MFGSVVFGGARACVVCSSLSVRGITSDPRVAQLLIKFPVNGFLTGLGAAAAGAPVGGVSERVPQIFEGEL